MIKKAIDFLSEVKIEIKKVTWPSKKEAVGGTGVVLFTVFIMSVFLGLVDSLLAMIVENLLKV
jgi:preprotein translocase subunit SecE